MESYLHTKENKEHYNLIKNGINLSFNFQGCGKYWIDDWDEFYNYAYDYLIKDKGILNFNQLISETGPLTLDFDFNYKHQKKFRIYNIKYNVKWKGLKINKSFLNFIINDVIIEYLLLNFKPEEFKKIIIYVFEKPKASYKKDKFKDGFHILVDYNFTIKDKLDFYDYICDEYNNSTFTDYFNDTVEQLIDKCVIDTNAWMIYGAVKFIKSKNNLVDYSEPYKLIKKVLFINDTFKAIKAKTGINNLLKLMKLFNIRKYNNINYNKQIIKKEKQKTQSNYNKIIELQHADLNEIDYSINKKLIVDILDVLKNHEEFYDYQKWCNIMFICKRYGCYKEFVNFSKCDKNKDRFNINKINNQWNKLKGYKELVKQPLSIHTLLYYCKKINQKAYKTILKNYKNYLNRENKLNCLLTYKNISIKIYNTLIYNNQDININTITEELFKLSLKYKNEAVFDDYYNIYNDFINNETNKKLIINNVIELNNKTLRNEIKEIDL